MIFQTAAAMLLANCDADETTELVIEFCPGLQHDRGAPIR